MKHITNITRSVATALLSVLVGTPSNAIYAHSCQLLLGGSKGWGLVAIKGTAVSPRVHYFGGQILSYGVAGNRLAVVASVFPATRRYPHSLRFSLWDTRNERLLGASNLSVVKLRPPPPMEGLIEGVALFGHHTAYFQAWEFIHHGGTQILSSSDNWLARVNLQTGTMSRNILIPLPRGAAPLLKAIPARRGVVLFCPRCGERTNAWRYAASTGRLSRLAGLVPKRGGLVFVRDYGLVAWGASGKLQRLTTSNMSSGLFPALSLPHGIVNMHVIYRGKKTLLACLAWSNEQGGPSSKPTRSVLYIYDLLQHKVLWHKAFKFPNSVLSPSFRVSPNGEVCAFINWWSSQVLFYSHRSGSVTNVKLPPGYAGWGVRAGRVVAVK